MNVLHAGLDELPKLKLMSVLGNFDCANFPGPIENVLEKVPMDSAEVGEIEIALRNALGGTLHDERPLHDVEAASVRQAQFILENA